MTMPNERTRALRWVGEFLRECRNQDIPEDLAAQIDAILVDYPSSEAIAQAAQNGGKPAFDAWLLPEDSSLKTPP